MTTQNDKPGSDDAGAKTQLRPSVGEWSLKSKDSESGEQIFPIRGDMLVGREGCDVPLKSAHASRKHARLLLEGGVLMVEDLDSANGTYVNDEKTKTAELKPGDEVRFDTDTFVVHGPPEAVPAEDDNKTQLRPAAGAPQAGSEPAAAEKPAPAEPGKSSSKPEKVPAEPEQSPSKPDATPAEPEKPSTGSAQPEKPAAGEVSESGQAQRSAWYERDTPNLTSKVEAEQLRDQLAEGGTQIVRGVSDVDTPSLIGTSGNWSGKVISLDKETMTVGRSGTDVILDEPSVSTKHAQIVREGDRWKIIDLMSANGVYVNGKKTQVAYLSPGDAVRFGRLEMRFVTDTTQVASRAKPQEQPSVITGSSRRSGGESSWLYVGIGFTALVVVALGAYFLFVG